VIEHLDIWTIRRRNDRTGFGRDLLSLGTRTYTRRTDARASARALSCVVNGRRIKYEAVRVRIIAVWRA
jgi:hypothetical protein